MLLVRRTIELVCLRVVAAEVYSFFSKSSASFLTRSSSSVLQGRFTVVVAQVFALDLSPRWRAITRSTDSTP